MSIQSTPEMTVGTEQGIGGKRGGGRVSGCGVSGTEGGGFCGSRCDNTKSTVVTITSGSKGQI